MSAVHRTDIADMEKDPVRIAMGDARHRTVLVFGQRIGHVALVDLQFGGVGKGLPEDRIIAKITAINQGQIIGSDRHGELFHGYLDLPFLNWVELDVECFFNCGNIGDGIFQLPVPVFPLGKIYFFIR